MDRPTLTNVQDKEMATVMENLLSKTCLILVQTHSTMNLADGSMKDNLGFLDYNILASLQINDKLMIWIDNVSFIICTRMTAGDREICLIITN